MSNANEFVSALAEMASAASELPKVQAELAKIHADFDEAERMLIEQDNKLAHAAKLVADLETDKAKLEAELASATFRASEADRKINSLRDILGADRADPVVQAEHVAGSKPVEIAPEVDPQPKPWWDNPKPEIAPSPVSSDDWVWAKIAQHTEVPAETPAAPLSGSDSQDTTYGVAGNDGQMVGHDPVEAEPKPQPEPMPTPKPYSNRPHWHKPKAMTWADWINNGGDRPYWIAEDSDPATYDYT